MKSQTIKKLFTFCLLFMFFSQTSFAIYEKKTRSGKVFPWGTSIRSFYDKVVKDAHPKGDWFLNLGPTGIRAKIIKDKPNLFSVQFVFQDDASPSKGKIFTGDIIFGANGNVFKTFHKFGRTGGWAGPLMELAHAIEDSQGKDGVLKLMVQPKGKKDKVEIISIQLRKLGRFSKSFPYDCERSNKMIHELCDFIIADYKSNNWKKANQFYGGTHGENHQLLALMASDNKAYQSIIKNEIQKLYDKEYSPAEGGFKMWQWGYHAIVMGEYFGLTGDKKLIKPMESLAKAIAWGSFNENGIYTHRSHIAIRTGGGKPYASIASISGLQMLGMSLFRQSGLYYDKKLHETIHQSFLRTAKPDSLAVSYALPSAVIGSNGRDIRHAIIKLKDPSKGKSGKGAGYLCTTGMEGIGEYSLVWPTKADHRYKPTDWIDSEAKENTLEELTGDIRRVDRFLGKPQKIKEPTKPYNTKTGGRFQAAVGLATLSHLIGNNKDSWNYLGRHGANTTALTPDKSFDGHAASMIHLYWSILGSARSDQPETLRKYFDYMKTFILLSECHDGGLYMQPWGRDPKNNDPAYGPRVLPTSAGIMLLSLSKKHLFITGKVSK
jgi:hypothetical protein